MHTKLSAKVLTLCLIIGLVVPALPVSAAPSPFGEDVVPLTTEELAEVEGEYGGIITAAVAGSILSTANYLITTPSSSWSVADAARNALAGAISGAAGYWIS